MESRPLQPIPTPPAQRWREIRLLYLPRFVFIVGIVLVAWMWTDSVAPSSMVAEAEILGAELRAPQAGVIASLKVTLHQEVHAGDVVGFVAAANARLLEASLAVIRAEVAMLSASMAGATDRQKISLDLEQLQLTWMSQRVNRAALQGKLQQAETDLMRAEPLHTAKLITDEAYDQIKITKQSIIAQLEEQNKLVARLEPAVKTINAADPHAAGLSGESALAAAIKVQDSKLKLAEEQLSPLPLVAPMDGVVSVILRRAGETVTAGEPVLRLTSKKPERLAGYLRQPLNVEPKPGMTAEIRTRSTPPKVASTKITQVGAALETITPTVLAAMRLPSVPTPETAVRIEFAFPAGLELRPGEHVDVTLR